VAKGVGTRSSERSAGLSGVVLFCIGVGLALGAVSASATAMTLFTGARNFSGHNIAWAVAIQPDGKLVAAGESEAGGLGFALVRYTPHGRLDPSFGRGGRVLTHFPRRGPGGAVAHALAIQTDGKLVAAGARGYPGDYALARYGRRGNLDPTFGRDGKVVTDFGLKSQDGARAARIQANGKITLAGCGGDLIINGRGPFTLARYTTAGRLDASFGHGGKVQTSFGARALACAFSEAIQPDGKLVVAGRTSAGPLRDGTFALARYTTRGRLDASFGRGGKVLTDLSSGSFDEVAVAIQADGKIVAAGASDRGGSSRDFALARYTANGRLDPSFGNGGKVLTDFGSSSDDTPFALAIQANGKLVVAGRSNARGNMDFALARYNQDGSLDPSFGLEGKVLTDFGSSSGDQAFALAIQADGRPVAAGWRYVRGRTNFALARYTTRGRLDRSFGNGGKVLTRFSSP
jgi:uncharacterized delta-60 repeat protein